MNVVVLDLDHYDFYCPVTGAKVLADGEELPLPSTVRALWVHECAEDPIHLDPRLVKKWEAWEECKNEDDFVSEHINAFVGTIDEPNWVTFSIRTGGGLLPERLTLIIDMNRGLSRADSDTTQSDMASSPRH